MTPCSLCPRVNTLVPPDGRNLYRPLFIGEAPGKDENRKGRVFIGKTGEEVNRHYLPLAGMVREVCNFTNSIKCLPTSSGGKLDLKQSKDLALLESCTEAHLYREIEELKPNVLVPMGAFACYAVEPLIDLDKMHGYPVDTRLGIPAFPMYHPAYGIHEPKKMLHIRNDWQRLRKYIAGDLEVPVDEYPQPDYREFYDADEIRNPDHYLVETLPLACDTESRRGGIPHCITLSTKPGSARLIPAHREDLLATLQERIARWRAPILWHNWPYDWPVTAKMGLQFPIRRIVDTMVRVYHLGNLPQGLKALAWRELGMEMEDFEDLVRPHSSARVVEYYRAAKEIQWPKPDEYLVEEKGIWKTKKPHGMNTKLKTFFTYLMKNSGKDVFGAWDNWKEEQPMLEEKLGPWPGMCISHVPEDQALFYACRDADALLRLWPVIKRMEANVRHFPQNLWRN